MNSVLFNKLQITGYILQASRQDQVEEHRTTKKYQCGTITRLMTLT